VVTHGHDEAMFRRYVSLFGRDIDWHPEGLDEWMAKAGPLPAPMGGTVIPRKFKPPSCEVPQSTPVDVDVVRVAQGS